MLSIGPFQPAGCSRVFATVVGSAGQVTQVLGPGFREEAATANLSMGIGLPPSTIRTRLGERWLRAHMLRRSAALDGRTPCSDSLSLGTASRLRRETAWGGCSCRTGSSVGLPAPWSPSRACRARSQNAASDVRT